MMEYLLKASAVIVLFYICYKVFLQRDTFFEHNRGFLLLGLLTAFVIPFLVIPIYIEYAPVQVPNFTINGTADLNNTPEPFNISDYLPVVYGLGVIFFSIRFVLQLISLGSVVFKNKRDKQGKYTFVKSSNAVSPFSFFNWIVYNPDVFTETELEQIIMHEKVHVCQHHTIDVLLAQLSCIVFWFNPVIWLYNKDLKQNLEFIADKVTVNNTTCKKSYQYTLLKTSMPTHQLALTNNFYTSLIKKRIVMLHKSKSKKINLFKYILIIPLLGLFLMSFNTEKVYITQNKKDVIEYIINKNTTDKELQRQKKMFKKKYNVDFTYNNIERNSNNEITSIDIELKDKFGNLTSSQHEESAIKPFMIEYNHKESIMSTYLIKQSPFKIIITKDFTDADFQRIIKEGINEGVTLKFNNIKRNSKNEIIAIDAEFKNNKGSGTFNLNGENPIKSFAYSQNKEGFGYEHNSDSNKVKTNKWEISSERNNVVGYTNSFKNNDNDAIITGKSDAIVKIKSIDGKEPLFIVDEKEISSKEMKDIDPETIGKVDVLKGDSATKKYGNKGKNGVIEITTKKKTSSQDKSQWKVSSERNNIVYATKNTIYVNEKPNILEKAVNDFNDQPLYILDEKEVTKKDIGLIDEQTIHSIMTIKAGEDAIKEYGDKGKNGVIIITTGDKNTKRPFVKIVDANLYIVDGKEISKEEFEDINPDNIKSLEVLKGESATKKYGDKGKNGVIEITTKKK